jgi:hypothetical protein
MRVKDRAGETFEVNAAEAQRLIEAGEAEPVAESPIARAKDADSQKAREAERRTKGRR